MSKSSDNPFKYEPVKKNDEHYPFPETHPAPEQPADPVIDPAPAKEEPKTEPKQYGK